MTGSRSEADLKQEDETIFSYVNVRDGQSFPRDICIVIERVVALAHVRAMDVPESSRQRIIISSHRFAQQEFCDVSSCRTASVYSTSSCCTACILIFRTFRLVSLEVRISWWRRDTNTITPSQGRSWDWSIPRLKQHLS